MLDNIRAQRDIGGNPAWRRSKGWQSGMFKAREIILYIVSGVQHHTTAPRFGADMSTEEGLLAQIHKV
jgi:hypothetical protein